MKLFHKHSVGHVSNFNRFKTFASLTLASLLIVSVITSPISSSALISNACNCVIFRLDDVQDYYLDTVQTVIMDKFIQKNEKLSLGIVMNFIGNDPSVVSKVKTGHTTDLFELTLHGWNHVDYQTLTLQQQKDSLQQANAKMQSLWGRTSKNFIPPYNSFNTNTLQAAKDIGLQVLSSEFDQEIVPTNKIYKAIPGSDIKDSYGVYHLPQEIGFYTYDFDPPVKTQLNTIMSHVDNVINQYGYAVVTLHPQDFAVKDSKQIPTNQVSNTEITDLDTLITMIHTNGYTIKTFDSVANVSLPPIIDNVAPVITPPPDLAIVSSLPLTLVSLGVPTVVDNVDPSPIITNNATTQITSGFPQGTTRVNWTASDHSGNTGSVIQYVTIRQSADTVKPVITTSSPSSGLTISGPAAGVNILVSGTSSDLTGVKIVEVRTSALAYRSATPNLPYNWSAWSNVLNVKTAGSTTITARATDLWGNQQWFNTPVTITLSGPDTTPPQITPPPNITAQSTGALTSVVLGKPSVFDNSDPSPIVSNNAGTSESTGFPLGTSTVTWKSTDSSGNSGTATQTVTIYDTTPTTTANPPGGTYTSAQSVVLTSNEDSTIYYTTNGTNPTQSSPLYTTPILISSTTTLKFFAKDTTGNIESVKTEMYTVGADTVSPTTSATPPGGTYASVQSVTLAANEPSTIYYTTNGTNPTQSSPTYTTPISIS
ncbi:MAG: chitobiase/beta-hexosaminidase C-terminal domain-containing protein, partial [Nitrosopumilus sp.]|nr:chitobiase/beta-hexosaminidase C-terminal domain-containing protein [Nitrosopumilus sp.]